MTHNNPEKILDTMIAWGRYAGIMGYDPATKPFSSRTKKTRQQ